MRITSGMLLAGYDMEYLRIIRELKSVGIWPTGNKSADKAKLDSIKKKLVAAIKQKANQKVQTKKNIDPKVKVSDNVKDSIMPSGLGAKQLGTLNRIYHQI